STATVTGATRDAASDAVSRSSETTDTARAIAGASWALSDAPRSGNVGMSSLAIATSPSVTMRDTLSTCVVALTSTVPNVSLALAPAFNASALRNTRALPFQLA